MTLIYDDRYDLPEKSDPERVRAEAAGAEAPAGSARAAFVNSGSADGRNPKSVAAARETRPDGADGDGDGAQTAETVRGVIYRRGFAARMMQGPPENKRIYAALKNELLSRKRVHSSVSFAADTFTLGRKRLAQIVLVGKTLKLYLALEPGSVEKRYAARDVGDKKKYARTPCCLRVRSQTALKKALSLIGRLLDGENAVKIRNFVPVDYAAAYPYRDTDALIARGLIKKIVVGGEENARADVSELIRRGSGK